MRGIVKTAEVGEVPGTITGDDGKTYTFRQSNVRNGANLQPGASVDFIGMGEDARDIYRREVASPAPPQITPPQLQMPATPQPGVAAGPASAALAGATVGAGAPRIYAPNQQPQPYAGRIYDTSGGEQYNIWQYFVRALTTKYADFNGRARRTEYWGYQLFWWLIAFGLLMLDILFTGLSIETSSSGEPWWLFFFIVIWYLGTIIPSIAIVVRRLHDLDLSGWLYLIKFLDVLIPPIGGLVIFVFSVMDGKPQTNQHGPSPKYNSVGQDMMQTFS